MKSFVKRSLSMVLSLILCCLVTIPTFAAEDTIPSIKTHETKISEQLIVSRGSLSGYGESTQTPWGNSSPFYFNLQGDYSFGCGMTIRATSEESSLPVSVKVYKPGASSPFVTKNITANGQDNFVQLYNISGGQYKVVFSTMAVEPVKVQVWMYA